MDKMEFIDLCKKGDEQALSLLYKTYSDKMMKICLRYVSDRQVAQDLLHDGFIIIFTSIETLRYPEKLESWMGMIMKNLSLRYLNQRNTINTIPLSELEEQEEPTDIILSDCFPSHDAMLQMIERLPDGYRKVFKLAILEGLSHKEISSILGIAPHSSSSQLFRAKEMLRKMIIEYHVIIILLLILVLPYGIWWNTKKETTKENKNAELKKGTNKQDIEILKNDSIKPALSPVQSNQYAHLKPIADTVRHETSLKDSTVKIEVIQIKGTINMAEKQASNKKDKGLLHHTKMNYSSNKDGNWSLTLAYSGGEGHSNTKHSIIPGDITSEAPEEIKEKVHHYMPITLSFSLHKKLNEHWGIETGIRYTHLRTDFTSIGKSYSEKIQKINYLGIPIKGVVQIWKHGKISIYSLAGVTLDIPVKATLEETHIENGQTTILEKQVLNTPLQWSIDFGAGFHYHITPSIGIYAEPNLHYYFNNGNKLNTLRKDQPFDMTLPVGIRFSW